MSIDNAHSFRAIYNKFIIATLLIKVISAVLLMFSRSTRSHSLSIRLTFTFIRYSPSFAYVIYILSHSSQRYGASIKIERSHWEHQKPSTSLRKIITKTQHGIIHFTDDKNGGCLLMI